MRGTNRLRVYLLAGLGLALVGSGCGEATMDNGQPGETAATEGMEDLEATNGPAKLEIVEEAQEALSTTGSVHSVGTSWFLHRNGKQWKQLSVGASVDQDSGSVSLLVTHWRRAIFGQWQPDNTALGIVYLEAKVANAAGEVVWTYGPVESPSKTQESWSRVEYPYRGVTSFKYLKFVVLDQYFGTRTYIYGTP